MFNLRKSWFQLLLVIVIFVVLLAHFFVPPYLDKQMNRVHPGEQVAVSDLTRATHNQLVIMDWHADTTLWSRDLLEESDYGHVDVPRLLKGNVAIQMFTTVTKVPKGLNYDENEADAGDQITQLAVIQGWPIQTWTSLFERAIYQAKRVEEAAKNSPYLYLIKNKADLNQLLTLRSQGQSVVGAIIGTEGAHPLEGSTLKIPKLYDAGFRMVSLQHFFDNRLGGSLHGQSGQGLTDFGRSVVKQLERHQIIIDVSHSSHAVVRDVLEMTSRPVVVSHTGVHGYCPRKRNLPDDLMIDIAMKGGLIAIGHWHEAVCGNTVQDIAGAIKYAIELVGVDHVALGSDFDGAVATPMDSSEMLLLTDALLKAGVSESQIAKVMGGNSIRFLNEWLPN